MLRLFHSCTALIVVIFLKTGQVTTSSPPNFPSDIPITTSNYQNWATDLKVKNLWIATPSRPNDVVTLANWAYLNDYQLRASGFMHNWSPLTVTKSATKQNVVLVNTRKHLNLLKLGDSTKPHTRSVTAQTGATMFSLLDFLEKNDLGLHAAPTPGDLTVGGVLAVGSHGTGIPTEGEKVIPGYGYGTLSNLIISLTAVVWNSETSKYVLKKFKRSDVDSKAFLVHLGRAFITEVTLMVGPNYNLRCKSHTNISVDELFADPTNVTAKTRTFTSFLNKSGRIETISFPYENKVWLKVWTISPQKPFLSRKVSKPFNYPFSDNIPKIVSYGHNIFYKTFIHAQFPIIEAGLVATKSSDIWGPSKNLLLYIKPTTLRLTANGYVVITKRSNIQKVVSSIQSYYNYLWNFHSETKKYSISGPMEIRVTLLDEPGVVPNGESPAFSAIHPIKNRPEFDVAVWATILSVPNAVGLKETLMRFESFLYDTFDGTDAVVRPEWSKGWAYTDRSAWSNRTLLRDLVPSTFPHTKRTNGWNWAVSTLHKYDPNRIFSNEFLDEFVKSV